MNRYLQSMSDYMANLFAIADKEPDPHRKAIMYNYAQHHAFELGGRYEEIFTSEMTIDHPVYHVKMGPGAVTTYDGTGEVDGFYRGLNEHALTLGDGIFALADWGVASRHTINIFYDGSELEGLGLEAGDPSKKYAGSYQIAMFWNYSADAHLIGEDVYQITEMESHQLADEDLVTLEQQHAVVGAFIR